MSIVFSTEHGQLCPECHCLVKQCECDQLKGEVVVGDGNVRIQHSTKGRKGKGVSMVSGLPLNGADLKKLAKRLKQKCGTGGTAKEGIIEIQGDQRAILLEELKALGYAAKISGG